MMDTRRTVSIVPPAGSQPPRAKSLRQQRASNGANIIKAYVQQSEQRREQSKFHASSARCDGSMAGAFASPRSSVSDDRCEDAQVCSLPSRGSVMSLLGLTQLGTAANLETPRSNQQQEYILDDAHALDALFAGRRVHRSRRLSVAATPRHPLQTSDTHVPQAPGVHSPPGAQDSNSTVMKPILRKRLQMESALVHTNSASDGVGHHGYRPPPAAAVPHHPRAKHNLGAKLDALAKSSMLNRRKVVMATDEKAVKVLAKNVSRHVNAVQSSSIGDSHGSGNWTRGQPETEMETRVMTAFRQIVGLWRERKRRAEAAAVSRMNGGSSAMATGTGRNGSKFRKDLAAQSSNVVGIISKRLIREIPALKFFDDEPDPPTAAAALGGSSLKIGSAGQQGSVVTLPSAPIVERAKPRGVCYTLDSFGCRKIKMQSSATIAVSAAASRQARLASNGQQKVKSEEFTLEKAMSRSLHRKMARRVKSRRQSILRLSDEFSKARGDLALKLRSQLVLQHAQIDKMFSTRLALLMSDDTSLPPYKAQKELRLARLRCKKANLLEQCETLRVLALILKQVEVAGEASGLEASTGELHFLDLFRCVVEEDQVLSPIIVDAIRQHMRIQDLQRPLISELFRILDSEVRQDTATQHLQS